MTRTLFILGFFACTLTSASLRADQTNTPAEPGQRAHPLTPTGETAKQPPIAGYAIGGPIGVLTDQQRASYEIALRAERGKMLELDAKLRAARQDLLNTSLDSKFDEAVIRQKAMAAAKIEAELAVLRIKAFSQVQPPLTPEEIQKIKAGKPGPVRRFERPESGNRFHGEAPAESNRDVNGLPPKQ